MGKLCQYNKKTGIIFLLIIVLTTYIIGCASVGNIETEKKLANKKEKKVEKIVVFETNQGNVEFELFSDIAPKTCENFEGLVSKGYYDGIVFHRVIKDFMIQGGDPTATGAGGNSLWGEPFEDEVTEEISFDEEGLLAMANSGPNTNGSQFFITTIATPWLNMKHTIFGKVISGYDVIEKIENTQTGIADKPVEDQVINKAYIKQS